MTPLVRGIRAGGGEDSVKAILFGDGGEASPREGLSWTGSRRVSRSGRPPRDCLGGSRIDFGSLGASCRAGSEKLMFEPSSRRWRASVLVANGPASTEYEPAGARGPVRDGVVGAAGETEARADIFGSSRRRRAPAGNIASDLAEDVELTGARSQRSPAKGVPARGSAGVPAEAASERKFFPMSPRRMRGAAVGTPSELQGAAAAAVGKAGLAEQPEIHLEVFGSTRRGRSPMAARELSLGPRRAVPAQPFSPRTVAASVPSGMAVMSTDLPLSTTPPSFSWSAPSARPAEPPALAPRSPRKSDAYLDLGVAAITGMHAAGAHREAGAVEPPWTVSPRAASPSPRQASPPRWPSPGGPRQLGGRRPVDQLLSFGSLGGVDVPPSGSSPSPHREIFGRDRPGLHAPTRSGSPAPELRMWRWLGLPAA